VPKMVDGRLVMGQPVLISRKSLGQSSHSGIPSCLVSREDGKVHVVWRKPLTLRRMCLEFDLCGDIRPDDGKARSAQARWLRRAAQRRPQFAEHHDRRPGLSPYPDRHAQQAVPVYAVARAE